MPNISLGTPTSSRCRISRGRYKSEGKFLKVQPIDATDGYDAIEWLAKQSYSNGSVGMWGTSFAAHMEAGRGATASTVAQDARGQHGRHVERVGSWRSLSRHLRDGSSTHVGVEPARGRCAECISEEAADREGEGRGLVQRAADAPRPESAVRRARVRRLVSRFLRACGLRRVLEGSDDELVGALRRRRRTSRCSRSADGTTSSSPERSRTTSGLSKLKKSPQRLLVGPVGASRQHASICRRRRLRCGSRDPGLRRRVSSALV